MRRLHQMMQLKVQSHTSCVGRAYLYGLMAGGQDGVERALEIMRTQMVRNMKLFGVNSLDELTPKHVRFLNRS